LAACARYVAASARKHGVCDDDMRHALRYPLRVADLDDGLTMFVGPARDGTLVEVGVADSGRRPDHRPRHAGTS